MTPPKSLAERVATSGYTARLTAAIAGVHAAGDEAEAVWALHAAATELGADAAALVSCVRDDDAHDAYRSSCWPSTLCGVRRTSAAPGTLRTLGWPTR